MAGKLTAEAERVLRENLASFDAEVAFELENDGERADLWTDIDVPVKSLRALLDELSRLRKALADAAVAAYDEPHYLGPGGMDGDGLLPPGSPYDRGRYDARKAVEKIARALSEREGQE